MKSSDSSSDATRTRIVTTHVNVSLPVTGRKEGYIVITDIRS